MQASPSTRPVSLPAHLAEVAQSLRRGLAVGGWTWRKLRFFAVACFYLLRVAMLYFRWKAGLLPATRPEDARDAAAAPEPPRLSRADRRAAQRAKAAHARRS
jgi:hypothetical protein